VNSSTPNPQTARQPEPLRHRWVIVAMLAAAIVLGLGAILTTWVKRQALDTGNWTNTSSKVLANEEVRNTLGAYMTDQLFTKVDVARELQDALPPQAAALAGPAAAGLQQLSARAAPELLARPRVQDAWRSANRAAHKQLLAVVEGGGNTVATQNGDVVLNLHALVDQLAATLGLERQVAKARTAAAGADTDAVRAGLQGRVDVKLPRSTGDLVILRSDQLATAEDVANAVRGLSILLTILSLGLFATAVWIARPGRRVALRAVGWSFIGLGLATLLARRVIGNHVVDTLVQSESAKPAVHDVWSIATSLLWAIGFAMVIYGGLIVAAAWLSGYTRLAVGARERLAPVLRDRPALVYATVGSLYLVVLVWGPTPAFRHLIPILLIAGLLVLGIETLRRQTAREFPAPAGPVSREAPEVPPRAPAVGRS
jgi:hypothetical protein